ncbi:MAG: potassium transporter TrkG [Pseudomonadota bacterium]
MSRLLALPLFVLLVGITGCAMFIPAAHAWVLRDLEVGRAFFYSGITVLFLFGMLAIVTSNRRIRRLDRSLLITLFSTFVALPLFLAVPFLEAVRDTTYLNAYFEMVSSLTTTGLTLFDADRLPPSVHLWRAMAGWAGGFFIWVTAVAILAPLSLGGFELISTAEVGQGASGSTIQVAGRSNPSERLLRFSIQLAPVYGTLTLVVWVMLMVAGDPATVAVIHAMSTLSTSGITSIDGGIGAASSGFTGEAILLVFLAFALSRMTFSPDERRDGWVSLARDPEIRLGLLLIFALPAILFVRHFFTSFEENAGPSLYEGIIGLWGAVFTVASFLTTAGFESRGWGAAQAWSGLDSPGVLLMGLAMFGGGVATTAGGVKLLRVYALFKHGQREMERLVLPSSIGGAGQVARRFRRQGAFIAWIFFMLFALSIAGVTALFAIAGLTFEEAIITAVATLSTVGPLIDVAGNGALDVAAWDAGIKGVAVAAMVLGRLETLVIIALLNPEFWR